MVSASVNVGFLDSERGPSYGNLDYNVPSKVSVIVDVLRNEGYSPQSWLSRAVRDLQV